MRGETDLMLKEKVSESHLMQLLLTLQQYLSQQKDELSARSEQKAGMLSVTKSESLFLPKRSLVLRGESPALFINQPNNTTYKRRKRMKGNKRQEKWKNPMASIFLQPILCLCFRS